MLKALFSHGIHPFMVKIIKRMYTNLKAQLVTDIKGEKFNIKGGGRQGDPSSLLLFNCALNEIFKNLNWESEGVKSNG